ncbi:MAG TPA: hypothetical protein VLM85_05360 [Polyangiaceae bacterium]|nr:hypothetical protein [Polyangiaceae bacterium]
MRTLFIVLVSAALGCRSPARADKDAAAPSGAPSACEKLGAPCTFAPGKLGTCVEVERPEGPSAFVCQSQH